MDIRKNAVGACTIAAAIFSTALSAEEPTPSSVATMWVRGYPITTGGKPVGCSIEYNAIARDFISKEGAPISVVGNISINREEKAGKVYYFGSLKVILNDLIQNRLTPTTPVQLHLVSASGRTVVSSDYKSMDSETPGGRLQMFAFDDSFTEVVTGILEHSQVSIAFNRREGGTDIRIPLDLTVRGVDLANGTVDHSPEMVSAFAECLETIMPM